MKEFAVIMAGGYGSRFWPLSRNHTPKQYLKLFGDKTLIQYAFNRNSRVFGKNNVFICTNPLQQKIISSQVAIKKENFILEPLPRDTAAAIGFSTLALMEKFGDCVIATVASDHLIKRIGAYERTIRKAISIARNSGQIVTIGIPPTYPSTAFGYIEREERLSANAWKVRMFREKPNKETAEEYISSGKFFWNASMFVFKAGVMLDAIKKFLPKHFEAFEVIRKSNLNRSVIKKEFPRLEKISIDYGIMEKAENVSVVKGEFDWDDVGSWNALERVVGTDKEKNTVRGLFAGLESANNIVFSDSGIVACIGIEGMVIVKTRDAVLVCRKNDVERVKELVKELEKKNRTKKFI